MKKLFVLSIIFFSSLFYSQSYKYAFEYDISPLEKKKDTISTPQVKEMIEKIISKTKGAERISFILNIKGDKSHMKPSKLVELDGVNMYNIMAVLVGEFYSDLSKNEIIQSKEYLGTDFLINITKEDRKNLVYTDEKKMINGYSCKRIILKPEYYLHSSQSKNSEGVSIWYTEDIKPKSNIFGLNDIKGLVVKVEDKQASFTLTGIEKESKVKKIEAPKKGKRVSVKEFDLAAKKIVNDRESSS